MKWAAERGSGSSNFLAVSPITWEILSTGRYFPCHQNHLLDNNHRTLCPIVHGPQLASELIFRVNMKNDGLEKES